jgi:serine protease AprX
LFANIQTVNGPDTCGLRYKTRGAASAEIFVEEETSKDTELDHANESVGYVTLWNFASS